mgnify:CR=1 FL=1
MKNNKKTRKVINHLYDPSKEGIGSYDVHYINASIKQKKLTKTAQNLYNERYAA